MPAARVLAQAKVNLVLMVGERDASGYHDIVTLFQRLDLADEIVVRVGGRQRDSLDVTGPAVPDSGLGPTEKNLAWRAVQAYRARTGWPDSFAIELTKHIPVGGGLGGGSADAGAVLRALNALAPSPLQFEQLLHVAAALGSDVAFLTTEVATCWASGRGEDLEPAIPGEFTPPTDALIVKPPFSVSSADAYRWLDEDREKYPWEAFPTVPTDRSLREPPGGELREVSSWWKAWDHGEVMGNDFERIVERRYPVLLEIKKTLKAAGADLARLAGSGSCVFGIFPHSSPDPRAFAFDALVIPTRTSARVVQVEDWE